MTDLEACQISQKGLAYCIRNGLHSSNSMACAEFIDDSVGAKACHIIQCAYKDMFIHLDDGCGMDRSTLKRYCTLYGRKKYKEGSASKFGMGSKTALVHIFGANRQISSQKASCKIFSRPFNKDGEEEDWYAAMLRFEGESQNTKDENIFAKYDVTFADRKERRILPKVFEHFGLNPKHGTLIIVSRNNNFGIFVNNRDRESKKKSFTNQVWETIQKGLFDESFCTQQDLLDLKIRCMRQHALTFKFNNHIMNFDDNPFEPKNINKIVKFELRSSTDGHTFFKTNDTEFQSKITPNWFTFKRSVKYSLHEQNPTKHHMAKGTFTITFANKRLQRKHNNPNYYQYITRNGIVLQRKKINIEGITKNQCAWLNCEIAWISQAQANEKNCLDRVMKPGVTKTIVKICQKFQTAINALVKLVCENRCWDVVNKHNRIKKFKQSKLSYQTKRQSFSPSVAYKRLRMQNGRCAITGMKLDEHQNALIPWDKDHKDGNRANNSFENCEIMTTKMHRLKTHNPDLFAKYKQTPTEYLKDSFKFYLENPNFKNLCAQKSKDKNLYQASLELFEQIFGENMELKFDNSDKSDSDDQNNLTPTKNKIV